jgi:sortase (surface protein transpeptidase)
MKKLFFFIIFFGILIGVSFGYVASHADTHTKKQVLGAQTQAVVQKETANAVPTTAPAPGIPETISIPKINVNTKVESVGMDSQGRMDVPKNPFDTAWYSPGFKPGMNGSAVIDGHLDLVTGAPAAFWNLKQLSVGDTITVTEDNGKKYTFAVSDVEHYPYNEFPIQKVFAASDVPMLNLITCNGIWDKSSKNYSDRLVVYSKLVSQN